MNRLRAALLLVIYAILLCVSAPGLDSIPRKGFSDTDREQALRSGYPPILVDIVAAIGQINPTLRRPVLQRVELWFRPLRIAQGWALYGNGAGRVRRLMVYVDGELRFRTGDTEHQWKRAVLRTGRLRPTLSSVVKDSPATNDLGLLALCVHLAREEDPTVQEVEIRVTSGRFPGTEEKHVHSLTARSPEWKPRRVKP